VVFFAGIEGSGHKFFEQVFRHLPINLSGNTTMKRTPFCPFLPLAAPAARPATSAPSAPYGPILPSPSSSLRRPSVRQGFRTISGAVIDSRKYVFWFGMKLCLLLGLPRAFFPFFPSPGDSCSGPV